jgi:hypothetical protein
MREFIDVVCCLGVWRVISVACLGVERLGFRAWGLWG